MSIEEVHGSFEERGSPHIAKQRVIARLGKDEQALMHAIQQLLTLHRVVTQQRVELCDVDYDYCEQQHAKYI